MSLRDRMVVDFTTTCTCTCAIVVYHHVGCEFEPHAWRGVLDKTVCDKVVLWRETGLCFFSGYSNFHHKSSNWNIFESGVKHLTFNEQMMDQQFVYVL